MWIMMIAAWLLQAPAPAVTVPPATIRTTIRMSIEKIDTPPFRS